MTPSEEDPEISTYFKVFTWLSATLFLAWVSYPIWKGWF